MKLWMVETLHPQGGVSEVRYYRSQKSFEKHSDLKPRWRGWVQRVTVFELVSQEVFQYEELYNPDGTARRQHE